MHPTTRWTGCRATAAPTRSSTIPTRRPTSRRCGGWPTRRIARRWNSGWRHCDRIGRARRFRLLEQLAHRVHDSVDYTRRDERGVQTPGETIARGTGTCRDYALLFLEAARLLGFAARFVSGYLHDAAALPDEELTGGGATHAWADVFVPDVGWVEFDPTNRIIASRHLLRVATTRTPQQALPLSGTYFGPGATFLGMNVDVDVRRIDPAAEAADEP